MADIEIPYNRDVTYFGKTNFRSTNSVFGIKRKDRRQHMYVLGKSGTGKSVLLSNLIIQDYFFIIRLSHYLSRYQYFSL